MLYIITKDELHTTEEYTWHVGQKNPMANMSGHPEVSQVIEVQADGDELNWILAQGYNLNFVTRSQIVRFFGDEAKFIVANSLK